MTKKAHLCIPIACVKCSASIQQYPKGAVRHYCSEECRPKRIKKRKNTKQNNTRSQVEKPDVGRDPEYVEKLKQLCRVSENSLHLYCKMVREGRKIDAEQLLKIQGVE